MPAGDQPADRIMRLRICEADGAPRPAEQLASYRALRGETVAAMAHANIRRQVRLVDALLDRSHIRHGPLGRRPETFDLREQVRAAVEVAEEAAALKGGRLGATLPDEPVPMWGDAARVQQVVSN